MYNVNEPQFIVQNLVQSGQVHSVAIQWDLRCTEPCTCVQCSKVYSVQCSRVYRTSAITSYAMSRVGQEGTHWFVISDRGSKGVLYCTDMSSKGVLYPASSCSSAVASIAVQQFVRRVQWQGELPILRQECLGDSTCRSRSRTCLRVADLGGKYSFFLGVTINFKYISWFIFQLHFNARWVIFRCPFYSDWSVGPSSLLPRPIGFIPA